MKKMHYRKIGSTDLNVSEIAFGTGDNAGTMIYGSSREQTALIEKALELGINLFDTSPDYGKGLGEANLGRVLPDGDRLVIMSTPVDDTHVVHWMIRYNPHRKLGPSYANPADDPGNWPPAPAGGPEERWGQDRAAMTRGHFSGFPGHLNTEDFAVCLGQGPIANRSKEYLNQGDLAIVRLRRLLLEGVRKYADRADRPVGDQAVPYAQIRASAGILSPGETWQSLSQ